MPHTYKFMDAEHTIVGRDDGRSFAWPKHIDNVANLNGRIAEDYRREGSPKISPYTESKPVAATKPKQQTKPPADPVAAAEQTITQLQEKREKFLAERLRHESDMGKHSFAAHARSDMQAVAALDESATGMARIDGHVREIDLALAEAGRVLQEARQAEATAADQARAAEARKLVQELGACFPYLDRKLAEAANALIAIHDGVAQLHAAGFAFPSDNQVRINLAEVIETWAHSLPRSLHNQLRDGVRFLPPGTRKSAAQYWAAIEATLNNSISGAVEAPVLKMQRPDASDRRERAVAAREFLSGGA
jgi:hypothetical protein